MSELMVLLQALLLMAGWLLFLRAQTELRAQAARQSLTGRAGRVAPDHRRPCCTKLAKDAARAEARIEARLRELETLRRAADGTRATYTNCTAKVRRCACFEIPPHPNPLPP
jgi:hypothetical protein